MRRFFAAYETALGDFDLLLMPTLPMAPTPLPPADAPRALYVLLWVGVVLNIGPDMGWFAYTPLSGPEYSPGKRVDIWSQMVTLTEISAMATAIRCRAGAMAASRCWVMPPIRCTRSAPTAPRRRSWTRGPWRSSWRRAPARLACTLASSLTSQISLATELAPCFAAISAVRRRPSAMFHRWRAG